MASLAFGWLLAMVLGLRHASEPDHVAAVTTLLAGERDARRGALLGAFWGAGHSAALLAVGGTLLALRLRMPGRVADVLELAVAAMLLALGARSLAQAARASRGHAHEGPDGAHPHGGGGDHVHVGAWALGRRPLLVGLVHGLAGSGALTALALANMPTLVSGLVYMLAFGAGSVVGMAALVGVAGWPLRRLVRRPRVRAAAGALAGIASLALGVSWGWPLVQRLAGA